LAIAAFNQRFTTDLDVVVPAQALEDYSELLTARAYTKTADVERNNRYKGRTIRFEKVVDDPVRFDAMVDALGCRQTGAEWSYRYLVQHSVTADLRTGRPMTARIPERELLFAVKFHSGRRADSRDLVVLAADADFDRIATHLHRGDLEALAERIDVVLDRLTSEGFEDAFKSVFEQQTISAESIDKVITFLQE